MSNKVQIFLHERFGKIRVVIIDGEPWFVAADVCKALGYTNSRKALGDHVPDKFKRVLTAKELQQMASNQDSNDSLRLFSEDAMGGVQRLTFVSEPGIYRLIMRSKLPKAEEFTDWVCGEVLVSIRKTGSYSIVDKPAAEPVADKTAPAAIRSEAIYRVYVFLLEDGNSKLGRTKRLCIRIGEVKHDIRLPISKIYFTPLMSYEDARLVERCCKEVLSSKRVKGEIFSVEFEIACAAVDYFVKLVSAEPIIHKLNIATVNLVAAEKST